MDNNNCSLIGINLSDNHNLASGQAQGNNTNEQSLHIAPLNPLINTGFKLQEHAIRLASVHGSGNRFPLPQASMNRVVSNGIDSINLHSTGIMLPQISAVPVANLNSIGMRLVNLNNARVVTLPSISQAVTMTTTPPLTTANLDGLSGSIVSQHANVSAGLCTSREKMSGTSSRDIRKERVNFKRQKKCSLGQNYRELPTSTQSEDSNQPYKDCSQLPDNVASNRAIERDSAQLSNCNFAYPD